MKIKNIILKQKIREVEKTEDYYLKVKTLCELAGLCAFYQHTRNDTHEELKVTEKLANDTIETIIKKYNL